MGRRRSDDFGISDEDIALIAKEVGVDMPGVVKRTIIAVVNEAIDETQRKAINYITERVNLTPDYIRRHLKVTQRAGPNSDTAILSGTVRSVLLSRFDMRQEYRETRDKRKRSGNRVRSGMSVAVAPGVRHTMASAFAIKLKMSGVTGLAVRPNEVNQSQLKKKEWAEFGRLGYAVLHGPSVDQLFKRAIDNGDIEPSLDEMAEAFARRIANV